MNALIGILIGCTGYLVGIIFCYKINTIPTIGVSSISFPIHTVGQAYHHSVAMKIILILVLGVILCTALAEPQEYRQNQWRLQARSLKNEGSQSARSVKDRTNEPTTYQSVSAPYPSPGWIPIGSATNGELLVFPFAVRERLEPTAQTTNEETPQVESNTKQLAAHKRPGPTIIIIKGKKSGDLKEEATQEPANESTKAKDAANTVAQMTKETVDVEKCSKENKDVTESPQTGYFVQLPDGSYQRIVQNPQTQPAFAQQPTNYVFQQFTEVPNYPLEYYPNANSNAYIFSTPYSAW